MRNIITNIALLFLAISQSNGASTLVNWHNTAGTEVRDFNGTLLTGGAADTNDGAALQLGYYTLATTLNPSRVIGLPSRVLGAETRFIRP